MGKKVILMQDQQNKYLKIQPFILLFQWEHAVFFYPSSIWAVIHWHYYPPFYNTRLRCWSECVCVCVSQTIAPRPYTVILIVESWSHYWTICMMSFGTMITIFRMLDANLKWHFNKKCPLCSYGATFTLISHHQFKASHWKKYCFAAIFALL